MSPIATDVDVFLKKLVADHATTGKIVAYVPAINLAIDAAVTAADTAVQAEGIPALAAHLPTAFSWLGPILISLATTPAIAASPAIVAKP